MMTIIEIDNFFQTHPLSEKYFSFSDMERAGCAAVAERDVQAALMTHPPETDEEELLADAAIAEQTVFLLLNPEYLTGNYTRISSLSSAGESRRFIADQSVLGQRAAALISPLLNRKKEDNETGGSSPAKDETLPLLNISRG